MKKSYVVALIFSVVFISNSLFAVITEGHAQAFTEITRLCKESENVWSHVQQHEASIEVGALAEIIFKTLIPNFEQAKKLIPKLYQEPEEPYEDYRSTNFELYYYLLSVVYEQFTTLKFCLKATNRLLKIKMLKTKGIKFIEESTLIQKIETLTSIRDFMLSVIDTTYKNHHLHDMQSKNSDQEKFESLMKYFKTNLYCGVCYLNHYYDIKFSLSEAFKESKENRYKKKYQFLKEFKPTKNKLRNILLVLLFLVSKSTDFIHNNLNIVAMYLKIITYEKKMLHRLINPHDMLKKIIACERYILYSLILPHNIRTQTINYEKYMLHRLTIPHNDIPAIFHKTTPPEMNSKLIDLKFFYLLYQ